MNEFRLVVHGDCVAKGRPRFAVRNGHAMAYTPAKTRRWEDVVRQTAIREWGNTKPIAEAGIFIEAVFVRQVPSSWSRKKREAALAGLLHPVTKPDLDNLFKAITDGLNAVVYLDDAQIVATTVQKVYGPDPHVEVTLRWDGVDVPDLNSADAVRAKPMPGLFEGNPDLLPPPF